MYRFVAPFTVVLALLSSAAAPPAMGSVTLTRPSEVRLRQQGKARPALTIVGEDGKVVTLTAAGFADLMQVLCFLRSCERKAELAMVHPALAVRVTVFGKQGGPKHLAARVGADDVQCTLVHP